MSFHSQIVLKYFFVYISILREDFELEKAQSIIANFNFTAFLSKKKLPSTPLRFS